MKLQKLYNRIISLPDIRPSDEVNALFSELVQKAVDLQNKEKLTLSERNTLQHLCSASEYELEKYWTSKMLHSEDTLTALREFPYYQNYKELTRMEFYALKGCVEHSEHTVLFIGGGPLPLTAIVLALDFGVRSTILDIDEEAIALSWELIRKLGLTDMIDVVHSSGSTFTNYGAFNTIFVAALAGTTAQIKNDIFRQIKKFAHPGTHLLARSSWGNRKLLYRPLSKTLYKQFKPIIELHPQHEVVNSIVIMKYEN